MVKTGSFHSFHRLTFLRIAYHKKISGCIVLIPSLLADIKMDMLWLGPVYQPKKYGRGHCLADSENGDNKRISGKILYRRYSPAEFE